MRYGIFTDIHSNLEALKAVLYDLKKKDIDQYICCGDIVGFGPNPNECIELIQTINNCIIVAGNHDYAAVGMTSMTSFSNIAREVLNWTQKRLSSRTKQFLKKLPLYWENIDFSVAHAAFIHPYEWDYIYDLSQAKANFKFLNRNVGFIGHTHRPIIFSHNNRSYARCLKKFFQLKIGSKYLINVGSVGQPRDKNPESSYVIYDTTINEIRFERLPYDIAKISKKIIEARLPKELVYYLKRGTGK